MLLLGTSHVFLSINKKVFKILIYPYKTKVDLQLKMIAARVHQV